MPGPIKYQNTMYMIWHDDEGIQFDTGIMVRDGVPARRRDFPHIGQYHLVVSDMSE